MNIPIINDPNQGPEGLRSCGPCTACCTVLAIPELKKPSGLPCEHASSLHGCAIHSLKPQRCMEFRCVWLDGFTPAEMRPDIIHGVMTSGDEGESMVLHEDPLFPGQASTTLQPLIDELVANGVRVLVVTGHDRNVMALVRNPDYAPEVEDAEKPSESAG